MDFQSASHNPNQAEHLQRKPTKETWPAMSPEAEECWLKKDNVYDESSDVQGSCHFDVIFESLRFNWQPEVQVKPPRIARQRLKTSRIVNFVLKIMGN